MLAEFAVKSWEDQILGALVAAPATVTDHAILKTRLLALFFFGFSTSVPSRNPTDFRKGIALIPLRELFAATA
ncbi:hypothetical protein ELI13_07620 [Rhizobium ruizarguesonis]|uniref:Uncharacterized protein n=1 Tax=Rhizobium ruizarguesonis TaxID=2081791 RepID=A0ABY1XI18_9HYPH|nr:hypothetical protein [Rhizobium ruizarguesonis]MBY5853758.1 hypothetical protein [Rhizobium leguminosarum]NKJ73982.1 hypothetical protein [Rhizobium leguminosarum bv. viciae]QIO47171.1 hypothetical protein HA464_08360 [Rhizobium leguminosarum bv. trifolii]MBY5882043.1 hypothetical protein [Rhizobium leguminosarum]